jgi:hypothetical protein
MSSAADDTKDVDRSTAITVVLGALIALAVVLGLTAIIGSDPKELVEDEEPPEIPMAALAERWLEAWTSGDAAVMSELGGDPAVAAGVVESLQATSLDAVAGVPDPARGVVPFTATAELAGLGDWTWTGELPMREVEAPEDEDGDDGETAWAIAWSPSVLHPSLSPGRHLGRTRAWPERAPLLAVDGAPLTSPALNAQVTGRTGEADAASLGAPYLAGDVAGVSGLQRIFERALAGKPSGEVQVLDDATGAVVEVLHAFPGRPGTPIRTGLDLRVQAAAEAAIADAPGNAALVAIAPSTGEIRATVSRPTGGFNRALAGRYPPGSTFKIVTTAALLQNGLTPDSPASCPEVANIDGRDFRNAEGAALGDIPFRRAFFQSCNTAFVQLASELDASLLERTASLFGFNGEPVPMAEPSEFPTPHSIVDQVSASIGQGRVLATPLQMASVAATVAGGAHREPRWRAPDKPVVGTPLPDGVAPVLQDLMRAVVAEGTGTAARLGGEPVAGKTGTAEFGGGNPPRTHVWFVGFRGDLAFAVVVEDQQGFGGTIAAPIARDFLSRLG